VLCGQLKIVSNVVFTRLLPRMKHSFTQDPVFTSPPKEVALQIIAFENLPEPGLNPRTLVPIVSYVTNQTPEAEMLQTEFFISEVPPPVLLHKLSYL
jgi:hypothetical protein